MLLNLVPLLSCLSFCRINSYLVVVESTAPWRNSKRPSQPTLWALNSTSRFVTTLKAWTNFEPSTNPQHPRKALLTAHFGWGFFFSTPSSHPIHHTSLLDHTRGSLGTHVFDHSLLQIFSLHYLTWSFQFHYAHWFADCDQCMYWNIFALQCMSDNQCIIFSCQFACT